MRAGKTYRHTDGSWRFIVDVNPPGAPRRQVRRSGFRTKREALAAMAEVQSQAHDSGGAFVEASRQTLGSYLAEWLTASKSHYTPGAWDAARLHVERYITPRIGSVPLRSLTTTRIKAFYAELAESGRVRGGGGLSNKTVHNVHRTLSRALNDAMREHPPRIKVNPAAGAHRAPSSPAQATWTVAQLRSFLEAHRDDRLHALWRLAASSGLRRGELAGLPWRDVDLETGRLAVSQQRAKGGGAVQTGVTKGKRGRTVALDEATRRSLREHRARQAEERLAVGAAWQDETGLVFTHPRRHATAPRLDHEALQAAGQGRGPAMGEAPRPPTHPRDADAGGGGAHQGRAGAARALLDRHHRRRVQPRHPWPSGRGGGAGRPPHGRHVGSPNRGPAGATSPTSVTLS